MLKERKDSLAPAGDGGGGGGGCLGLYLADAPTKQDPTLTHASWIKTAMKLAGPLEIKRSPLPKCIDEETEAPETKLSPLFSRGNDSGESALPQTQASSQAARPPLAAPHPWSGWHPSPAHLFLDVISVRPPLILISLG